MRQPGLADRSAMELLERALELDTGEERAALIAGAALPLGIRHMALALLSIEQSLSGTQADGGADEGATRFAHGPDRRAE